jgi:hypothetical protein
MILPALSLKKSPGVPLAVLSAICPSAMAEVGRFDEVLLRID